MHPVDTSTSYALQALREQVALQSQLVAKIITGKFVDALSLYRECKVLQR